MNKKELSTLILIDLKRSGLNNNDIKKMGLKACDEDQAAVVLDSDFSTCGYVLPYFNIAGKQTGIFRFRFLKELINQKGKVVRYSQLKGTDPHLYFSPCIAWKKILKDTSITITFTEGEKKAYTACKAGIPTIGLGGVWSFKSKRLNKSLIDDFKYIALQDRKIQLCFDSDSHTNDDVMKALRAFAKELHNQGANVFNKVLPFNAYEKIGLDDYLLKNSKADYNELEETEFEEITEVGNLNDELAYIKEVGKIYIFNSTLFVSDKPLVNLVYANRIMQGDNGPTSVAQKWLNWSGRRTHQRLTYKPGEARVTKENEYNLWEGWGCIPKKGSVKIFTSAIKQLFDKDEKLITWFMDWIAYPIQNPGAKMLSAILLQSVGQGTGKSTVGLCIGEMYGKNYKLIDDAQLHSGFNEWAINKQFVLGDEISGRDKKSDSDKIKNLITRPEITINKKYAPTYTVPDCINYMFTSNHVDALNIEPDDRRMFVYSVDECSGLSLEQGQALEMFRNGRGTSHLLYYFIHEYVISKDFDHRARPPMTQAKENLIDHSLTDIERFLEHVKLNPDHALSIDGVQIDRDLFTTSQIVNLYQRNNTRVNVTLTAMGKAVNKIFWSVKPSIIRTSNGIQKIRPLRNFKKWEKASHNEMVEHFDRSKIALFEAKKLKHKR